MYTAWNLSVEFAIKTFTNLAVIENNALVACHAGLKQPLNVDIWTKSLIMWAEAGWFVMWAAWMGAADPLIPGLALCSPW